MSKPVYRPLFKSAFKIIWKRKGLWFLGIFAGIANTGAILEVGFRATTPASGRETLSDLFITNIVPGSDGIRLFLTQFQTISPTRAILTSLILIAIAVILLALAIRSQGGLIKGALTKKKKFSTFNKLLAIPAPVCWRIFAIDVVTKIIVAALLAASSVPLALFATGLAENIIASFVVLTLFILIILVISLLSIFSIASVVQGENTLTASIEEAWSIFIKHPLVTLEIAVLLFIIHLIGTFAVFLILLFLWIPYTLCFLVAILTATTMVSAIVSLIVAVIAFTIILLAGGILTSYQYVVWALVYEKLRKRGLKSKFHRFKKTFRIL